jgi:hypothetical protein
MTLTEAAAILDRHNAWRRGEMAYGSVTAKEIGQAIDIVVAKIKKDLKKEVKK